MNEEVKKAWEVLLNEVGNLETMGDNIAIIQSALESAGGDGGYKEKYENLRKDYINRFIKNDIAEAEKYNKPDERVEPDELKEPDITDLDFDGRSE